MDDCIKTLTQCGVCRDTMVNPQQLQCLHSFCRDCIQRVSRNQSVVCPYCKATTRDVDVKNDFKTQQLIEAQSTSTSDTYTASEQATHHRKELTFMKASCQRKIDTIIENHKDFSRVVLSKMHAAKRAWNEAFDREIQQADTFLEKKISVDYRVRDLKETIQILDNTQIAHHVKNHAYSWTF